MSTDENDITRDSSVSPWAQSMDVVVVGTGASGCHAAVTIANAGYDVTIVERKPEEETGHIACSGALRGADVFLRAIPKSKIEPTFANTGVDHGRFEVPQEDTVLDVPVPGELTAIDHWEYGRLTIKGAEEVGADLHYNTVIQDIKQDDDGTVIGIVVRHDGKVIEYDADIIIDGVGSLSLLQDEVDFSDVTFGTNVPYQHFSLAYRKVVEVPEPIEWSDALVFKSAEIAAGYVWYLPRIGTETNVGFGFQMTEEPMKFAGDLKKDLRERPEFEGAEVIDKLGVTFSTHRPHDSTIASDYIAVGNATAHVNPTTGGGTTGTAHADKYVGKQATIALDAGDVSEELLWCYNQHVMDHFDGRYASLDMYGTLSTAVGVDDLIGLIASISGERLAEALCSGATSFGPVPLTQTATSSYDHRSQIYEFFKIKHLVDKLLTHHGHYPSQPNALEGQQVKRDRIMDDIYELTGANPKC